LFRTYSDIPVTPPPGVGPHDGRELELMLAGRKPLACFSEVQTHESSIPEEAFEPYVSSGAVVTAEQFLKHPDPAIATLRFVYYALPSEQWRFAALMQIHERIYGLGQKATDRDEKEIGHLLGYHDADIAAYIAWRRKIAGSIRRRLGTLDVPSIITFSPNTDGR
jgi:hypothetical protein